MNIRRLRLTLSPKRFMVQLMVVLLVFTIGSVLALGIPAALLLNQQSRDHISTLLMQSSQTSGTLMVNKQIELANLAMLLANRPTLNALLETQASPDTLSTYLAEFQQSLDSSVILICKDKDALAFSGTRDGEWLCEAAEESILVSSDAAWILAQDAPDDESLRILIGQEIDTIFNEFSTQSGLTYLLAEGRTPVASNLPEKAANQILAVQGDLQTGQTFSLDDYEGSPRDVRAIEIPFTGQSEYRWIGILDTAPYTLANNQLRHLILVTLILVSLITAILSVLIARRVSRPLSSLAQSAARLREGNLEARITTVSNLWEVDQLANALEDARVSLSHSLNQIQKEKAWIEDLLNAIVEGLLTLDDRDRVTFASRSTTRITGKTTGELLRQPVDAVFTTSPGEDAFSRQIPETGQVRRIPAVVNGEEVLLAVSRSEFIPPDAGNATRALVIRDVTDEERVHNLIGEFLANITHEFRTPLAALSASVELLVDDLPNLSEPEIDQLLRAVNIGIVNLQSLIDNLIEAASIEAGRFKVNPQPVELSRILTDAITTMEPIARLHQVTINRSDPKSDALVNADKRRTVQVLINLLSNAIKHSPEGGRITIRSLQVQKDILVEVEDQGKGIPEILQNQIFNRFLSPGDDSESSQLGLGLGLSVVKTIIEAQHGQVGFRDAPNGGALFWFTLPLSSSEGNT
ncbi:HAMP domain-containing protein [bacterium]|nr:HAMP domain-containing protein [bacterium]